MSRLNRSVFGLLALALASSGFACAAPPPVVVEAEPRPGESYSADQAWTHLDALVAKGPRPPGSAAAQAAREYINEQLDGMGLDVREAALTLTLDDGNEISLTHLIGLIPGESTDVVLLMAHYDTASFDDFEFVGANDGASGPAVLLELVRQLKDLSLPYTVWAAFVEGEAGPVGSVSVNDTLAGSSLMLRWFKEREELERIRLAVIFDQVGDAELTIDRERISHRVYRDTFFDTATKLGYQQEFPQEFRSVSGSHDAFIDAGFRSVVLLTDSRYGGDEAPGSYARTAEDTPEHCSPRSLGLVGRVSLVAIEDIMQQMEKVDRLTGREPAAVAELPAAPADAEAADEMHMETASEATAATPSESE